MALVHTKGGTKRQRQRAQRIALWAAYELMHPRMADNIEINIDLCIPDGAEGFCTWADDNIKPREFDIEINNQFEGLKDPEDRTQAVCSILADSKFKLKSGTLSIAFVDDASIKGLHDSFLGDPSSTDVITFPGNPTFESAGEICISIDEAIKEIVETN